MTSVSDSKCEIESEMDDGRWETAPLQESSVYNDEEINESVSSSVIRAYPVTSQ